MKALSNWNLYRSFLAVLREGSLSAAAQLLQISQPTIGRHIDQLEAALGRTTLFTRSPHGLTPTESAYDLLPHAEAMAAAAASLVRAAAGDSGAARGTLRLTASEVVGAEVLPGILAGFRARHPGIAIELALDNRAEDLMRREADIAVRMVRPTQNTLVARHLGAIGLGLYAHRHYADLHGLPLEAMELPRHALIGFDRESEAAQARRIFGLGLELTRESFALRAHNHLAQLALIRAGCGIGICQHGIARRDPDLLPVLAELVRPSLEVWLVTHGDLRTDRRVRLMMDHLAEGLSGYIARSGFPAPAVNA